MMPKSMIEKLFKDALKDLKVEGSYSITFSNGQIVIVLNPKEK